jgi:hypothetical protein
MCNGRLTEMQRVWNRIGTELQPSNALVPRLHRPITALTAPSELGSLDQSASGAQQADRRAPRRHGLTEGQADLMRGRRQ